MSKDNIKTTYIDGDLSIGEDLHIGGNATQHGDSHIKGNVKIEGWLDAPNVKSAYKGFFICEADLEETYPTPRTGWWAVVGDTIPGPIYISVKGKWTDSGAVGGLTGEEIHIAKELGQNDYAISQKTVTDALAERLQVINAEPYFKSIPNFTDNTVVICNADGIPYGSKIVYEFLNATPKPLLAFYDSRNTIDNTIVYKGFMTDPLRCIIITLHKGEGKATFKVINIPDESDLEQKETSLSGGILDVQDILSQRPPEWAFSETFVQESRDGDVIYVFDQNSITTGAFWYRFLGTDGITCCCKKWYNSYLYNDESKGGTGKAKDNTLFHCKYLDKYFIIKDGTLTEFLNYKVNKSDIVTTLGDSEKKVMSQKTVTDALADKADKKDLDNKLSVVELPSDSMEFIKDSSNDVYKAEYKSEILDDNSHKNVIFEIFNPRLIDTTTSNVTVLTAGENFRFSFAKHQQGKYYYNTTLTNLKFYKEGTGDVFKKYNSVLVTLVLDVTNNTIELRFDNANNFEKLEVEKGNYKIVLDGYNIYTENGGDDRFSTSQMALEPERLSLGSPYQGQGAVLLAYTENDSCEVETVHLQRVSRDVAREGIKLSDGKVKFYHDIDDREELPIIVTGIADPNNDNDAVNKKYVDKLSNDNIKTYTYRDKIFLDESPNFATAGQRFTMQIFSNNPLTQTPKYGDIFRIITDVKDDRNSPEGTNNVSGINIYHNETTTFYPLIGRSLEIKRRGTILDVIITQDGKAKIIYNSHTDPEIGTPLPTKLSQFENDTNFSININLVTINDWVSPSENLIYNEEESTAYIGIYPNERVVISNPININSIYILPLITNNISATNNTMNFEIIFSTSDSVPEIGFYTDDIGDTKWAKEPIFNPNKTYAISIESNNINGSMESLAMYAEFDLNMEE